MFYGRVQQFQYLITPENVWAWWAAAQAGGNTWQAARWSSRAGAAAAAAAGHFPQSLAESVGSRRVK